MCSQVWPDPSGLTKAKLSLALIGLYINKEGRLPHNLSEKIGVPGFWPHILCHSLASKSIHAFANYLLNYQENTHKLFAKFFSSQKLRTVPPSQIRLALPMQTITLHSNRNAHSYEASGIWTIWYETPQHTYLLSYHHQP